MIYVRPEVGEKKESLGNAAKAVQPHLEITYFISIINTFSHHFVTLKVTFVSLCQELELSEKSALKDYTL